MTRDDGLWIFAAVTLLRVNALVVDFALLKLHLPTITEYARRNTWLTFVILGLEAIGLFGLAVHLASDVPDRRA